MYNTNDNDDDDDDDDNNNIYTLNDKNFNMKEEWMDSKTVK